MKGPKAIRRLPSFTSTAEILGHLDAECDRLEYRLANQQQMIFHELLRAPNESALARMHHWWTYDLQRLLPKVSRGSPPKPRISLSIWLNQRGTLIVSWRPTSPRGDSLEDSDFRDYPYLTRTDENRLVEVRDFRFVIPFHEPDPNDHSWGAEAYRRHADVSENRLVSNALLLHAAAQRISELKERLSYCFTVTMIEDVYLQWEERSLHGFTETLKTWEIKNVLEHEKEVATKLLDEFEASYGCTLATFVEVLFAPDVKKRTGPPPQPHTKIERSVRKLKALGYSKITLGVVDRYLQLLKTYHPEVLPPDQRPPSNVVPFNSKK